MTEPKTPITIGITVIVMFQKLFEFSGKDQVLNFLLAFFQLYSVVSQDSKIHNRHIIIIIII